MDLYISFVNYSQGVSSGVSPDFFPQYMLASTTDLHALWSFPDFFPQYNMHAYMLASTTDLHALCNRTVPRSFPGFLPTIQ